MITDDIRRWWQQAPWRRPRTPDPRWELAQFVAATFSTLHGQRTLAHLMDTVYCTVYQGNDPLILAAHNGRRSVVHEILELVDYANSPQKYETKIEYQGVPDGLAR